MDKNVVLIWCIGFIQWILLPLLTLYSRKIIDKIFGIKNLLLDLFVTIAIYSVVILLPLDIFGMLPLGSLIKDYMYASTLGALLSIPLTKLIKERVG